MYSPRKPIRFESKTSAPGREDLQRLWDEGIKNRGALIQQPWRSPKTYESYNVTVQFGYGPNDAICTLYAGDGAREQVVWAQKFDDVDLFCDVLNLTLGTQEMSVQEAPLQETESESLAPESPASTWSETTPVEQEEKQPLPLTLTELIPEPQTTPIPPAQVVPPQEVYSQQANDPPPYPPPAYATAPEQQPAAGFPSDYMASPNNASSNASYPQVQPAGADTFTQQPYSVSADSDLLAKRPNVMLGAILVETGLIPAATLKCALQLQDMIRNGTFSAANASEAVRRAHARGGSLDSASFAAGPPQGNLDEAKSIAPPLGEILVGAGLIPLEVLKAALDLQEVVRQGMLTKEQAIQEFIEAYFGKAGQPKKLDPSLQLLKDAGLLQEQDLQSAISVQKKHGGEVAKILIAAGKLDAITCDAASTCQSLIKDGRFKSEQAIIALHYCHRSRVTFDEAIDELRWPKP